MGITIPGVAITNRVSSTVQYSAHLMTLGDPAYMGAMRVTFVAETDKSEDLEVYRQQMESAVAQFNGAVCIGLDNSLLLHFLEPKQGDTIQTYFKKVQEHIEVMNVNNSGIAYLALGGPNDIPTITKNGIRVFVTKQEPTLEYLATILLKLLPWARLVRATTDTGISATVSWTEQPTLL